MEIILLRHGKPDINLTGTAYAHEVTHHIERYDHAPVKDTPPAQAIEVASTCDAVVCSSLVRSHHSAAALNICSIHVVDKIFNEVAMPHFKNGAIKLPIRIWIILYRLMSLANFSRNGESYRQAKKRAKHATAKLIKIATYNKRTLLVGHGFINHLIAKELQKQNWKGPKSPGKHYWSFDTYRKLLP